MSQIVNEFCHIDLKKESVVTIGKFDAVHKGHQKLLKYTVNFAKKNNLVSIAILIKKRNLSIYNIEENTNFIKELGINYIIVIDFLPEFYTMEAKEFFNKLIEYYRMKHIAVGFDFAFGRDREGDIEFLYKYSKEFGIGVSVIKFLNNNGNRISSSSIRDCLSNGKIKDANKMLGREYTISGEIVHGNALGRKIGYPTANLEIPNNIFIPKMGVYSSIVRIGNGSKYYKALTFIGISNINKELRVESHILDFSRMIYGKKLTIIPLKYIRDNIKVNSIEEVKLLLKKDEYKVREFFKKGEKMSITADEKLKIIKEFGKNEKDTGSAGVQIALLTNRISYLKGHFQTHTKDNHSRMGLLKMVAKRRKLLNYLRKVDIEAYKNLIQKLKLRK